MPNRVLFFRDHTSVFHNDLFQVVDAYRHGQLPLWDPYTLGGKPLAAYPNSLAYSPFLLVFLLPGDFLTLYDWFVLLHYPVAGLSAYYLARTLDLHPSAAALTGLAYGLGGPLIASNNLLPYLESTTFGPAAIALALRVANQRTWMPTALFAVVLSLHVYSADPAGLFDSAAIFTVLVGFGMRDASARDWARGATLVGVGATLAALMVAIQVLPLLAMIEGTVRGAGYAAEAASSYREPLPRLLELVLPNLCGDFSIGRTIFGNPADGRIYFSSVYAGALTFPLAAAAIQTRQGRALGLTASFFALLALGSTTPLFDFVWHIAPPLRFSRFTIKHMYGASVCWSLLAGLGLHALLSSSLELRARLARRGLAISALLAAVALFLGATEREWLSSFLAPNLSLSDAWTFVRRAASHTLLVSLLGAIAWLACTKPRCSSDTVAVLWIALFGLDLALAARPSLLVEERDLYRTPPAAALVVGQARPASAFLYHHYKLPPDIPDPSHADLVAYQRDRMEWSAGIALGVRYFFSLEVNDALSSRWMELSVRLGQLDEPRRISALGRFGVTHLLVEADVDSAPGLRGLGQRPTRGGPPITVFALEKSRGPAHVASRAIVVSDAEPIDRVLLEPDLGTVHLQQADWERLDPELRAALQIATSTPTEPASTVRAEVIDFGPNHVVVSSTSPSAALLVVTQRFAPGWEARVNGRAVDVLRADEHLLAVPIDAGESRVELRYRPSAFRVGALLSAAGACATAFVGFVGLRRRRPRR